MTPLVNGGAFGRSIGVSADAVRQLCQWRIIEGHQRGSSYAIDPDTAPSRDEIIERLRRAITVQARRAVESTKNLDKEVEAIRNDAEIIIQTAADGGPVVVGEDIRDQLVWSSTGPVKDALLAITEAQLTVALIGRVLDQLEKTTPATAGLPLE